MGFGRSWLLLCDLDLGGMGLWMDGWMGFGFFWGIMERVGNFLWCGGIKLGLSC